MFETITCVVTCFSPPNHDKISRLTAKGRARNARTTAGTVEANTGYPVRNYRDNLDDKNHRKPAVRRRMLKQIGRHSQTLPPPAVLVFTSASPCLC